MLHLNIDSANLKNTFCRLSVETGPLSGRWVAIDDKLLHWGMFNLRPMRATSAARQGGFTLMELMVVVAIMAILAGLAAPSFSRWIQQTEVNSARDSLEASIFLARTEALRTGAPVTLRPLCPGAANPWDCGWQVTTGAVAPFTVVKQVELGPGVGMNLAGALATYTTGARGTLPFARFDVGAPKGSPTPVVGKGLCISVGARVRKVDTYGVACS